MRSTFIATGIMLAFASAAGSAQPPRAAADLSFEELLEVKVAGASRFEQPLADAPSAVSVITANEIKTYGYRHLADVLRAARGLYVWNDRQYEYAGVRGLGRIGDFNSRILVLLDGQRINDNVFDQAFIGYDGLVDLDLVERVEIIRGPSSAVYGGNAFLGAVNVVTKNASAYRNGEVAVSAGRYNLVQGRLTGARAFENGAEVVASATGLRSRGPDLYFPEFDDPATSNGHALGADAEGARSALIKFQNGGFSARLATVSRKKGMGIGSYGSQFNNANDNSVDAMTAVTTAYERTIGAAGMITGRATFGRYNYVAEFSGVPPAASRTFDTALGRWWTAELQAAHPLGARGRAIGGIEFQDNVRQNQKVYDSDPDQVSLDAQRRSRRISSYLQTEYKIMPPLTLSAGGRYDSFSQRELARSDVFSPRVAGIYRFSPGTVAKLIYGTAFRPANVYERYYEFPGSYTSNPNLAPERIRSTEAVVEHAFDPNTRLIVTGYRSSIKNLISQTVEPVSGLLQFQNLDSVESRGLEAEAERRWLSGAQVRASWSLQRAVDSGDRRITNSPTHLAKLNLGTPKFWGGFRLGLEGQFIDRRKTDAGDLPAIFLANTNLLWQSTQGLEVALAVRNIGNRRYSDPVALDPAVPGRESMAQDRALVRLRIAYRF